MVLGKPGSGKTTFLKYLAIRCNQGYFEPGSSAEQWKVERLLDSGKAIILLDGLDEVSEKDSKQVIQQIADYVVCLYTTQLASLKG